MKKWEESQKSKRASKVQVKNNQSQKVLDPKVRTQGSRRLDSGQAGCSKGVTRESGLEVQSNEPNVRVTKGISMEKMGPFKKPRLIPSKPKGTSTSIC